MMNVLFLDTFVKFKERRGSSVLGCLSLRKSKIGFLNPKESENGFCLRSPRSLGSWCVKETEESTLEVDSPVPLPHLDPKDLGFICVVKKRKIHYRFLSDLRILSWIFLKKRTVRLKFYLSKVSICVSSSLLCHQV